MTTILPLTVSNLFLTFCRGTLTLARGGGAIVNKG